MQQFPSRLSSDPDLRLESFSLRTAVVESNRVRAGQSWVQFVRHAKAAAAGRVAQEDIAALIGLMLALAGVVTAVD